MIKKLLAFLYDYLNFNKTNLDNLTKLSILESPRFFSLSDFDLYKLKRTDINITAKNKNSFILFKKYLMKNYKRNFNKLFFFKNAKIHSFFIIFFICCFLFYFFALTHSYDSRIPLTNYFYSTKPEELLLYLQNFEEIKKNQNFHFFASENFEFSDQIEEENENLDFSKKDIYLSTKKRSPSFIFNKFFYFDTIFFTPDINEIETKKPPSLEFERSFFFKQFFENSLEKSLNLSTISIEKSLFAEDNSADDSAAIIVQNSIAALKQKEYVKSLASKKNFLLFNHPKYAETFMKTSRFQNFLADLGLIDIKLSDFNKNFIEKEFPFKASHYKKSHIQALSELGINSKEDFYVLRNSKNIHYQKGRYDIGSELNITLAANKFSLIQDQLNFFFLKNTTFRLFLLNKTNVDLKFNSFNFVLNSTLENNNIEMENDLTLHENLNKQGILNLLHNSHFSYSKFLKLKLSSHFSKNINENKFYLLEPRSVNFFTNLFYTNKYITINKTNFNDLYLFWFNYFDLNFLKFFKKRDFLYMLESYETGFFKFPDNVEDLEDTFFFNTKKKFKHLKKEDPLVDYIYAVTPEQYESALFTFLDFQILLDNPQYNKYQEGCFDFFEGFTDKFLLSNSFISLNKEVRLNDLFFNLQKYEESYNKILYIYDLKIKRLNYKIKIERKNLTYNLLKILSENYQNENKMNFFTKDISFKLNSLFIKLFEFLNIKIKIQNLKSLNSETSFFEKKMLNFYINKSIQNFKFINNSFIYNIEKKNVGTEFLKKKIYFFNVYNEFLSQNFAYFFTKKISSKYSYLHVNIFNKDFLSYFKNITYYFKEQRFLFFYDSRNKNIIQNYKDYEKILYENYAKNKEFDSYSFMLFNYDSFHSNFVLTFIDNLKNAFKQQTCWNNLQNKKLKLNNEEVNIILDNLKSLYVYFKINSYNSENSFFSKYISVGQDFLPPEKSAFFIFHKLEENLKENIQIQFLLKNYYNTPKFFISSFDRLNFFLHYNYYHGVTFKGRGFNSLNKEKSFLSCMIFTYTENILDKSLLLRTQNRFLSLEYYSMINKISKIETALNLIDIEKKKIPYASNIYPNEENVFFPDTRPINLKYPFPFVSEHLLLEREFFLKTNSTYKLTYFQFVKKTFKNSFYFISQDFYNRYCSFSFWQYQKDSIFFVFLYLFDLEPKININFNSDNLKNNDSSIPYFINKYLIKKKLHFFYQIFIYILNIQEHLFLYFNEYFFDYHTENYIKEKKIQNQIYTNQNFLQKWIAYSFFFLLEIGFSNYMFVFSEYNLLENQRLLCIDLHNEKHIDLSSTNLRPTSYSGNSKVFKFLFKYFEISYYNKLEKAPFIFNYINFISDDYYFPCEDEEETLVKVKDNYNRKVQKFSNREDSDIDLLTREDYVDITKIKYDWLLKSLVFISENEDLLDKSLFFQSEIKNFMIKVSNQ